MYKLPLLPYNYQELEPYIDTHTIGLHYHKHMKKYLDRLNMLLLENNYHFQSSTIELAKNINETNFENKSEILFNLGGVINHEIYFNSMSPNPKLPEGILKIRINNNFGSYEEFKKVFKQVAMTLKGSGYTFLVLDQNNQLQIINLPNQENPYTYHFIPLIGVDLWEHAYYLNYKNNKELYIDNFLEILSFEKINEFYNNRIIR